MSFTVSMSIVDMFNKMSQMEARICELESRLGMESTIIVEKKTKEIKKAKVVKETKEAKEESKEVKETGETKESGEKKRGRKPSKDHDLKSILQENETIVARIPLGERKFQEYEVSFSENMLTVLETGDVYDHPTTLVSSLAKILEDCGERSSECSKSMNGWMLCVATRDGKKVSLEKLIKKKNGDSSDSGSVVSDNTNE